jgi:phospholipase C
MNQLASIEHIVVLMLENRSQDHLLGFLYTDAGNVSPSGQPYEGLTESETNPGRDGEPVAVHRILPARPFAYFQPGAVPEEGYPATNKQLFGSETEPTPPLATNQGFVTSFADALDAHRAAGVPIVPGTTPADIMGCYDPSALPVLSGLARGYAVCDHWYGSVPTATLPNRAFAMSATSQGHVYDPTTVFTAPTIFASLTNAGIDWCIYGYESAPMAQRSFADTDNQPGVHFGQFVDFEKAAASGALPAFSFLEPDWSSTGNSQHPAFDVALGETLINRVYRAVHDGPAWPKTLLVVTYDEHGGLYDHVAPPGGATPPDDTPGGYGFGFRRFGPRVPTVLVSPLIEPGTVFRVPADGQPLDHTSVLRTIAERWELPPLTARDAAAPAIGAVLTRSTPRTDDPLADVVAPAAPEDNPYTDQVSHLQRMHAVLVAGHYQPDQPLPELPTPAAHAEFINRLESSD